MFLLSHRKTEAMENNSGMFPLIPNNAITTLGPLILEHLISSEDKINKYCPERKRVNYDWIRNPFTSSCISSFQFIVTKIRRNTSAVRSLKIKFSEKILEEFWISVKEEYSKIS